MPKPSINPEVVRYLVEQGLTDKAIAERLDCHMTSVGVVRRRHGIKPLRPKTDKINPYIVMKLKVKGMSDNEIAQELGCTRQGVWQVRKAHNFMVDNGTLYAPNVKDGHDFSEKESFGHNDG